MGVRLRFEPNDSARLQKDYLAARGDALRVQSLDKPEQSGEGKMPFKLWPATLPELLQRRLNKHFFVKVYTLDPKLLIDPKHGIAQPQHLTADAEAIDGNPFKGLIPIDEISAQRGFGEL
ncbi:hypothetical protein [Phaeovulum sp.]|uniref:hypothetical protein n=1 Tax=Phaeovulum sp. TaxID=2934796 RepID=UPI0039E68D23